MNKRAKMLEEDINVFVHNKECHKVTCVERLRWTVHIYVM